MLKHKNDFDSPKTPVRRKNSTVSIMSLPVSVNSSDSGTGTIRGAHGTIQGGAKCDKSAVSNLSLPVSVISVDSGTGTIRAILALLLWVPNLIQIAWVLMEFLKSLKKQDNTFISWKIIVSSHQIP